jgi:hypothetical protein
MCFSAPAVEIRPVRFCCREYVVRGRGGCRSVPCCSRTFGLLQEFLLQEYEIHSKYQEDYRYQMVPLQ